MLKELSPTNLKKDEFDMFKDVTSKLLDTHALIS